MTATDDEATRFRALQARLRPLFARIFPDPAAPRTVLVNPSLTLDSAVMAQVSGVEHYESRLLCLLLLLQLPRTRVVFLSSRPIDEAVIDYYLHLLTGVPHRHARERLTMLSCDAADGPPAPLSQRLLDSPATLARLRAALGDPAQAHMVCFTVTALERRLALALDAPVNGCDPDLAARADKSGGRRLFRDAGLSIPDGAEDLRDAADIAQALADLKRRDPGLRRAVVKLNEGFSGDGNALFGFDGAPQGAALASWTRTRLSALHFEGPTMDWPQFERKFATMGGIVEAFVDGADKRSPSMQCRIDPLHGLEAVSTHDQVLGGAQGGVFQGCVFPADPAYRLAIQRQGLKAGRALEAAGALGRFSVDFISVRDADAPDGWRHNAIEINLRKGGTTHPFIMLQMLTHGAHDPADGQFRTPDGATRCYYATDNLAADRYRGMDVDALIDMAVVQGLHYSPATQTGVTFHLMGALRDYGKLGAVCIERTPQAARALFDRTVAALDAAAGARGAD